MLVLLAAGVLGYTTIEGWSFLDALYMTVITVTTVGFQEVHPLSGGGRIFTMALVILGVGTALYILVGVVTLVIEGELGEAWGVRRMKRRFKRCAIITSFAGSVASAKRLGVSSRSGTSRSWSLSPTPSPSNAPSNATTCSSRATRHWTPCSSRQELTRARLARRLRLRFWKHLHYAHLEGAEPASACCVPRRPSREY